MTTFSAALMFVVLLASLIKPVLAASTLPLSYQSDKPVYLVWGIGLALALVSSIAGLLLVYFLSAFAGTTGNKSDITSAFGFLVNMFWLPVSVFILSPFLVAWFLHKAPNLWVGKFHKSATEFAFVVAILSAVPLATSLLAVRNFHNWMNPFVEQVVVSPLESAS